MPLDPNSVFQDFTTHEETIQEDIISASGVPFWGDNWSSWETLILAGQRVPGLAKVGGKAFEVRADRKKVPGESGETLTTLGREPCEPEIVVKLWTSDHLDQLLTLVKSILPKGKNGLPAPVDAYHPALALYRVRAIRVMSASYPEEKKEGGEWEVKLKFREHRPGDGAKPKTDNHAAIIPEGPGAVQAKIAALRNPAVANGNGPRGVVQRGHGASADYGDGSYTGGGGGAGGSGASGSF